MLFIIINIRIHVLFLKITTEFSEQSLQENSLPQCCSSGVLLILIWNDIAHVKLSKAFEAMVGKGWQGIPLAQSYSAAHMLIII